MVKVKIEGGSVDYIELFCRIDDVVRDNSLYLDSKLRLEVICRLVGTNRTYASRAIGAKYKNFSEYLKLLRLEYFVLVILSKPFHLFDTIDCDDMAISCGFKNRRSFDRALLRASGLTYSQVRKDLYNFRQNFYAKILPISSSRSSPSEAFPPRLLLHLRSHSFK